MAKIGDKIQIIALAAEPKTGVADPAAKEYEGRIGVVEYIDDLGILHGTWGGLGILPKDTYKIL